MEPAELALRGIVATVVFVIGFVAARARQAPKGNEGGPRDTGLD